MPTLSLLECHSRPCKPTPALGPPQPSLSWFGVFESLLQSWFKVGGGFQRLECLVGWVQPVDKPRTFFVMTAIVVACVMEPQDDLELRFQARVDRVLGKGPARSQGVKTLEAPSGRAKSTPGDGAQAEKWEWEKKTNLRAFAEFSMQALDEERTADAWTGTERGNALHSEVTSTPLALSTRHHCKMSPICLPGLLVYALQPGLQLAQEKFWTKV
ncbi:hypothetical protein GGX14DRAFT_408441 [Mycena pura]|uniref:Uncharacterized protein n=1 Tax=Mycena pura TaxID=153505 RepID=A0AAD6XZI7_9AGAR|nr:hypothetical protein GGX14DRAFT_408441 [Mycena pura]